MPLLYACYIENPALGTYFTFYIENPADDGGYMLQSGHLNFWAAA